MSFSFPKSITGLPITTHAAELEGTPHALQDTIRLDRDAVMAPVDHPAFGVVHDEDDAVRERNLVWCKRGEEGLEHFLDKRHVRRGVRTLWGNNDVKFWEGGVKF